MHLITEMNLHIDRAVWIIMNITDPMKEGIISRAIGGNVHMVATVTIEQ